MEELKGPAERQSLSKTVDPSGLCNRQGEAHLCGGGAVQGQVAEGRKRGVRHPDADRAARGFEDLRQGLPLPDPGFGDMTLG